MIKLNTYIIEAWSGVKKQSLEQEIKSWCEEMGIKDYTINSKGEIDVDGNVWLASKRIKELPYKFGSVSGRFDLSDNKKLMSLKNCPNEVGGYFSCQKCNILKSLEGCPKEVKGDLMCNWCEKLTSLIGCTKYVEGSFFCNGCSKLDSLEGCPQKLKKTFYVANVKENLLKKK